MESCKGCKFSEVYYHGFKNGKAVFSYFCKRNGKHMKEEEYEKGCAEKAEKE